MRVRTYTLDGTPGVEAELSCDDQMQLWLDDRPILAVSLSGAKIILTLADRLVLIATQDYGRITKYGALLHGSNAVTSVIT